MGLIQAASRQRRFWVAVAVLKVEAAPILVAVQESPTTSKERAMFNDAKEIVNELYSRIGVGDPEAAAELFAEPVDWDIPGAPGVVPWIGTRQSRAEIVEFFTSLDTKYLIRDYFTIDRVVADGDHAVAIGRLRATVRDTGKVIVSPFTIHFTVTGGQITHFLMLEDSWNVAEAFTN
ncbi:nuclear transport factor 2 family protein [Nocardia sp. CA-128927]|uniref:nuclear transport factor 2 family protein n=1 Tax=Nocardia sp. CA-128927 TaxID=3239975 RepID=UPI003D96F7A8